MRRAALKGLSDGEDSDKEKGISDEGVDGESMRCKSLEPEDLNPRPRRRQRRENLERQEVLNGVKSELGETKSLLMEILGAFKAENSLRERSLALEEQKLEEQRQQRLDRKYMNENKLLFNSNLTPTNGASLESQQLSDEDDDGIVEAGNKSKSFWGRLLRPKG